MEKVIIDNGIEIPYTNKWKDFVFWCNECKCYHIDVNVYERYNLSIHETDKLIEIVKS